MAAASAAVGGADAATARAMRVVLTITVNDATGSACKASASGCCSHGPAFTLIRTSAHPAAAAGMFICHIVFNNILVVCYHHYKYCVFDHVEDGHLAREEGVGRRLRRLCCGSDCNSNITASSASTTVTVIR